MLVFRNPIILHDFDSIFSWNIYPLISRKIKQISKSIALTETGENGKYIQEAERRETRGEEKEMEQICKRKQKLSVPLGYLNKKKLQAVFHPLHQ